jgi:peptide/nickel transport system substrate-binding protein
MPAKETLMRVGGNTLRAVRSLRFGVGAVVSIVGALFVATSQASTSGKLAGPDNVTVRIQQDWFSLDPMVDASRPTSVVAAGPSYDRLLALDPKSISGTFLPYLATRWVVTPRAVTFWIRRGAKCVDGHEMDQNDVAASINRYLTVPKRTGNVASASLGQMGNGPFTVTTNAKDRSVVLATKSPYRNIVGVFKNLPMICPAGFEALKSNPRALEQQTYGSGPYVLDSLKTGDQVTFKIRPEWNWGPKGTSTSYMPQSITYKVVADETTAANLLLTGGLTISSLNAANIGRVRPLPGYVYRKFRFNTVQSVVFNMRAGRPFGADPVLRHAVFASVDPKAYNQAAMSNHGTISPGLARPGNECYNSAWSKLHPGNPSVDDGKKILQQGGYTYSGDKLMKNGKQVSISVLTNAITGAGADYFGDVLRRLGFDVTQNNAVGSAYGTAALAGNFDIAIQRGAGDNPAPGSSFTPMSGGPSPDTQNIAYTGGGDRDYNLKIINALKNTGALSCKYLDQAMQYALKKWFIDPLVAYDADVFGKGVDFLPAQDGILQPYWIKPIGTS